MTTSSRLKFLGISAFAGALLLSASGAWAEYQIVKTENGTLWRLNTETGEIAMCKAEGGRMVCASSGEAIKSSGLTAADLEDAAERRRAQKNKETMQMVDKLVDVFERLLSIAERHQPKDAPPPGRSPEADNIK